MRKLPSSKQHVRLPNDLETFRQRGKTTLLIRVGPVVHARTRMIEDGNGKVLSCTHVTVLPVRHRKDARQMVLQTLLAAQFREVVGRASQPLTQAGRASPA